MNPIAEAIKSVRKSLTAVSPVAYIVDAIALDELLVLAEPLPTDCFECGTALPGPVCGPCNTPDARDERISRLEAALHRIVGIDSHIEAAITSSGNDRKVVVGHLGKIAEEALESK